MRSIVNIVLALAWAVFIGFATYFISWALLAGAFHVDMGADGGWPRIAGAVIGILFAFHAFNSAWSHLGPGIGDFILFPLRYLLGMVLASALVGIPGWLIWHYLEPYKPMVWIVGGLFAVAFAPVVASAAFDIPFQRELTLASIIRSLETARRIGFPFPRFIRNYFDEKVQDAREGSEHLRGSRLMTRRRAEEKARALVRRGEAPPLQWCGIGFPRRLASTGFLATGMTGSGKTAHLNFLLRSVLPSLGQHGESRAVIYDYKTEVLVYLLARFGIHADRVKLFHPFDLRTAVWNIAADIHTESDAMELTRILLPPPTNHPDAEFFSKAAALVVGGVIQTFNEKAPGNWDLRDLVLGVQDPQQIREVLEASESNKPTLRTFFSGEAPGMTASVLATIAKDIQYYRVVASMWYWAELDRAARRYSLRDWTKSNDVIVLGHSPSHVTALQPIMRLIFDLAAKRILDESRHTDSEPDRTWFVLDELPNLGRLDMLGELLRAGRSKGACVFLGFQDLASLYKAYDPDTAHSLLNNIGNQAHLKLNDPRTAEWASKFFTEREVTRRSETKDKGGAMKSAHEGAQDRPIVPPRRFLEANAPGKLRGFFDSNELGSWEWELPVAEVIREVPSPTDEEKRLHAYQRAEEKPLPPWTEADRQRLGLAPPGPPDAKRHEPESPPPPTRQSYRKHRERSDRSESQEI